MMRSDVVLTIRTDLCTGDRIDACVSCVRSIANAPDAGDAVPTFRPIVRERHCGDWKHAPVPAAPKPEDKL